MHKLAISVRNLVEFLLMEGDLDTETYSGSSRMLEGTRMHQRLQKKRPNEYQKEVSITHEISTTELNLLLRGRIDGVFTEQKIIEEIKSTTRPLEELDMGQPRVHWGQACVYACIYCMQNDWPQCIVRLTYGNLDTGKTCSFDREMTLGELEAFFIELIADYQAWALRLARWNTTRTASLRALDFPFCHYRAGQRAMAVAVYRAIADGTNLLAEAPTGIGKTMATLFPALKSMPLFETSRIFYFTARTTGKQLAEQTLALLRKTRMQAKVLTLTAKEKICMNPGAACIGDECPWARGFFDRLRDAVMDCFEAEVWDRACILHYAEKHQVCPFEFSLTMALWADVIIGDYNYGFDPRVRLKRFFADPVQATRENNIFLIDEAHNLLDRSREMFSAEIHKKAILDIRRPLKKSHKKLYALFSRINSDLLVMRKAAEERGDDFCSDSLPEELIEHMQTLLKECDAWLAKNIRTPWRNDLRDCYFEILRFLRTSERFGDHYCTLYQRTGSNITVRLFCLHPAPELTEMLACSRSAVFFSATLSPMHFYAHSYGLGQDVNRMSLPSPFPQSNLLSMIAPTLSTRYKDREKTAPEIARMIHRFVTAHNGNYLVFFPSYAYLQKITELLPDMDTVTLLIQQPGMSEEERQTFLDAFTQQQSTSIVGCAVMGGVFGEGIDLAGNRLVGAVIVGVGLPGISFQRDCIRDYYHSQGSGFDFAYRFPGFTRVLQAVGRVIRTECDRGAVLLIDDRLSSYRYRQLMPAWWHIHTIRKSSQLLSLLQHFWQKDTATEQ